MSLAARRPTIIGWRRNGAPIWSIAGGSEPTIAPAPAPTPAPEPANPPAPQATMTTEQVQALMARTEREAPGKLAAELGFKDAAEMREFVAAQRKAADEAKTEEQKRIDAAAAREAAAAAATAEAARLTREAQVSIALAGLGAVGANLTDAGAILARDLPADADQAAITEAAGKLKERRAELFTAPAITPAPQTDPGLPPNPAPPATEFGRDGAAEAARRFPKAAATV